MPLTPGCHFEEGLDFIREKHTHKHAQEWNGYQILHNVLGINFLRTDSEFGLDIGGMELIDQTGLRKQYMQDKQKKTVAQGRCL